MNREKMNLWNRDFELFVNYSCYPGEEVTEIQKASLVDFLNDTSIVSGALDELKLYIEKTSDVVKADEIDNIFKYVIPISVYVPRTEKKAIGIICNYKFDMEHGIAIVFEEGKIKEIGTQDIIL